MKEQIAEEAKREELGKFYRRYPFEQLGAMCHLATMLMPSGRKYENLNAFVDSDCGVVALFARIVKYESQRLFHTAFEIPAGDKRYATVQELPLSVPTWYAFLNMTAEQVEGWRDLFLDSAKMVKLGYDEEAMEAVS